MRKAYVERNEVLLKEGDEIKLSSGILYISISAKSLDVKYGITAPFNLTLHCSMNCSLNELVDKYLIK